MVSGLMYASENGERHIEAYLRKRFRDMGLPCLKYANAFEVGYPDRLILLPKGLVLWVEVKSKGRKPTAAQRVRHEALRSLGHKVYVIDNRTAAARLADGIRREYLGDASAGVGKE